MPLFCILNRSSLVRGSMTPSWVDLVAASGVQTDQDWGVSDVFGMYSIICFKFNPGETTSATAVMAITLPNVNPPKQLTCPAYCPPYSSLVNNLFVSSHFLTSLTETCGGANWCLRRQEALLLSPLLAEKLHSTTSYAVHALPYRTATGSKRRAREPRAARRCATTIPSAHNRTLWCVCEREKEGSITKK